MEELIAQYIMNDYYIKCNSTEEIKIAKNAAVRVLGFSRSGGENIGYPYIGKETATRVCGYRFPSGTNIISFSELTTYIIPEGEVGDMNELL